MNRKSHQMAWVFVLMAACVIVAALVGYGMLNPTVSVAQTPTEPAATPAAPGGAATRRDARARGGRRGDGVRAGRRVPDGQQ